MTNNENNTLPASGKIVKAGCGCKTVSSNSKSTGAWHRRGSTLVALEFHIEFLNCLYILGHLEMSTMMEPYILFFSSINLCGQLL